MGRVPVIALACVLGALAAIGTGAFGAEPPKPESAKAAPASETTAKAGQELKLPPGWKKKKRGKFILYCKKEAPMGTRLQSETCYDEPNMRNYILALQESKSDIDRIRSTCSNICTCGDPGAC